MFPFKKKEKEQIMVDKDKDLKLDGDGNPIDPKVPDSTVIMKKEEYDGIMGRLDAFDRKFEESSPIVDTVPVANQYEDELKTIDSSLATLDEQIAKTDDVAEMNKLWQKRTNLSNKRQELKTDSRITQAELNAAHTISQLTSKVISSEMPLLSVKTVKDSYESNLAALQPNQRATLQGQEYAYNLAVGNNIEDVVVYRQEIEQRKAADILVGDLGGGGGKKIVNAEDDIPSFSDYVGKDALQAIKAAGMTIDTYIKRHGFETQEDWVKNAIASESYGEGQ